MTTAATPLCRCGHPRGGHTWRGLICVAPLCICVNFAPAQQKPPAAAQDEPEPEPDAPPCPRCEHWPCNCDPVPQHTIPGFVRINCQTCGCTRFVLKGSKRAKLWHGEVGGPFPPGILKQRVVKLEEERAALIACLPWLREAITTLKNADMASERWLAEAEKALAQADAVKP